ncbi:sigma-70 family RNA polymerase sigma factor [Zavarzinella formosa]|uniref:sigma-70 family RNA polymerase sigma factor n=1 Tax=Zavarzinella formosa TaxID=360055 RepID=UPI0002FEF201|nr:sigma-70 family RNA polymerase sigma factor [Zavarzinella formosa]
MPTATPTDRASDARPLTNTAELPGHLSLARALAWKFIRGEGRGVRPDDMFAEALFALAYANQLFDADRGVPFKKYAVMVICHRLRQLVAKCRRRQERELPLSQLAHFPDKEGLPASTNGAEAVGSVLDAAEMWDHARQTLQPREFEVVRMHCQNGESLAAISRLLGVSRQRVSQILGRAVAKLRPSPLG